ncbi:scamp family-domain-containing protein [Chytridium lagenaria]|nr:scamp family-domain-containing protein [Chytridium lagenaria]
MRRRLEDKDAELAMAEARLKYREAKLTEREQKLGGERLPNWPPFRPLIYHDIQKDIPEPAQKLVKRVYAGWFLNCIVYFINFIAAFALLTQKAEAAGTTFALALVIMCAGIPVSFVFWYRPLYKAVKHGTPTEYMFFMINYGIHLLMSLVLAIGFQWGGAGIIYCLAIIGSNFGTGVLCAIASTLLILEVIYGLWQIKSVRLSPSHHHSQQQVYYHHRSTIGTKSKPTKPSTMATSSIGDSPTTSPSSDNSTLVRMPDAKWSAPSREESFVTATMRQV